MNLFPNIAILDKKPEEVGYNGQNDAFQVRICRQVQPGFSWLGVLAQEVYEWRYSWKTLQMVLFIESIEANMELNSHAIEARVAADFDGFDFVTYEDGMADRIASGSYKGLFGLMSKREALAELQERRGLATDWVRSHTKLMNDLVLLSYWEERHG